MAASRSGWLASPATAYHGDTSRVIADVRGWLAGGWRVALVTEGHGPAQRLAEILRGENLGARAGDLAEAPEPGVAIVATGLLDAGFIWPQIKLAVLGEDDISGQRTGRQGPQQDAEQAARRHRPAAAHARRLRRAQPARRRQVPGDDQPDDPGRDPRVPGDRVRAEQARPAAGPALPADRPARRGDQVLRRRGAEPAPARRRGLGQDQGPRAQGGARDRRPADQAVLGQDRLAWARVRPGHAVAARARGRVPLHRDARPARRDRRDQARHGEGRSRWTG